MKKLAIVLVLVSTAVAAAQLVSQSKLPDGRTVCVYSNGKTIVTTFNTCPSFIQD